MNYTKPAITLIDAAKSAIQGVPKSGPPYDNPPTDTKPIVTVAAYEADE
jgi:hypothetical protein